MSSRDILPLMPHTDGIAHQLCVRRFGTSKAKRRVYVQAGLHADEVPAMLVAVSLMERLQALEDAGRLRCEVVLLNAANPIGLAQFVLGTPIGRFDLGSGRNFNRGFPLLGERVADAVQGRLTDDLERNRQVIREAWRAELDAIKPRQTLDDLQVKLMQLSVDADIVLDLHCSREADMYVYAGEAIWEDVEPLARYLGARASLLAIDAGGQSFDEAHSLTWWQLQQRYGERFPIPRGTVSVTVEHRGQRDVSNELANQDAEAIVSYLSLIGMIDAPVEPPPPLPHPATPVAGCERFHSPVAGILVHLVQPGSLVRPGDAMFEIVDPIDGTRTRLHSSSAGMFYMRRDVRYVRAGDPLGRVTGERSQRTGNLLSA